MTSRRHLFRAAALGGVLWSFAAGLSSVSAGAASGAPAIATEIVVSGMPDGVGPRSARADPSEVTLEDCQGGGSCWTVASILQLAVTLTLGDHTKTCARSCRIPFSSTYLIRADDTYEIGGGLFFQCANSGAIASMGAGTVTRRGRKFRLHPDDPAGLQAALTACLDGASPHFGFSLRTSPDGTLLRGRTVAQGTVAQGDGTAHLVYRFRHKGLSVANGGTPVAGKHLRECPPVFVVRCELVVTNP